MFNIIFYSDASEPHQDDDYTYLCRCRRSKC